MIITLENLADIRRQHQNKSIVLTSGSFDLLHVGHLRYLEAVKAYGDIVIVMLSSDDRIKARKGLQRPIIPASERAQMLDALKMVDYVFIDPAKTTQDNINPIHAKIIASLQPDIYVTDGIDVRFSTIMERSKLIILPRVEGGNHASTSAIIEHIAKF